MAEPEEIQEWLDKAEEDRRVAEVLLRTGEELTLPTMFHLQQMLEKLLKALILATGNASFLCVPGSVPSPLCDSVKSRTRQTPLNSIHHPAKAPFERPVI